MSCPPIFGSVFSGIGLIDHGLEKAGWEIKWQIEQDDYCRSVLRRHWPRVRLEGDIVSVPIETLEPVDLIAGGFPCEDVSHAGRGAGLAGKRSGLWAYFAAAICLLRPKYALVENVPGLYSRGLGTVLADLAAIGYDAEWDCIPAAAVGAPHLRARVWILAYPSGHRESTVGPIFAGRSELDLRARWPAEPTVARVVDGRASRVDRARINTLGRAAVPQVAEWIGRRLLKAVAA